MSPAMACVPGARRRRSSSRSCSNARIVPAARQLGPALVLLLWLLAQALWAPAAVAGGIETGSGIEPWGQTKGSGAADVVPSPPPLSQQRPRLRVSNKGSNSNTGRPLLVTGLLALAALLLPPLLARACRWLLAAFPALGRLRGDRPLGGLRFRWADYSMRAPLLLMDEEEEDEEEEEGASEDGRLEEGALGLVMPLGLEAGGDGSEGETTDEEEEKRLVLEEEAALTRVRRQQRRLLQRREWYSR